MRKLLLLLAPLLLLLGCDRSESGSAGDGNYDGSIPAPQPPSMELRESQLLADNNYWVFEFYVVDDPAAREAGRGKWYAFKSDGTFRAGHWETEGAGGSWGIYRQEGKTFIWMDSVNDSEDSEYEIQANATGDEMSWIGTRKYRQEGVMLKAINLMSMPTKKQFGLE